MTEPILKLTCCFGERQRAAAGARRPHFLADALLDVFGANRIATSVALRGITGFGGRHVLRTDESLTLSEDPPAVVVAVDTESTINTVLDEVQAMMGRGLVTLERVDTAGSDVRHDLDPVKLTVYVGRQERIGGSPAHRAVCSLLYRHRFFGASVLLGVDGTVSGARRRAAFFSRNVRVPLIISAVGSSEDARAALAELRATAPPLLVTVERVQVCKRDGARFDRPHRLPPRDDRGLPLWQKLTVHTSEATMHRGTPVHRALVRALLDSGTARGATTLRGVWGFHGAHEPHGDRLFQLTRRMPVATIIIDTPERIARSFDVVDDVTARHGLVTSEMVPAALTIDGPSRYGTIKLAQHDY